MTPTWLLTMKQMPQVKQLYMDKVVAPRRDAVRQVLRRGVADGVIDAEVDLDTALTCLSGPAILVGMHRASGYQAGSVSIGIWSTSFSTDCSRQRLAPPARDRQPPVATEGAERDLRARGTAGVSIPRRR